MKATESKTEHQEERRAARRFEVGWELAVERADPKGRRFSQAGMLQNLSSSGAFFIFPKRVKVGTTLEVEIRVPMKEKSWMRYSAKIVRVKQHGSDYGVAVSFATARPAFIER